METAGGAGDSRNVLSDKRCSCGATRSRCWCCDCSEPLCDDCVSAHRRVTVTRSHRILDQPPGNVSASATTFCRLHPSETLKLFCFTCRHYTCRDCQLTSHMNHRFQFVSQALDETWKQLEDTSQPIRAQIKTIGKTIQDISARLHDLVEGQAKMKTELRNAHNNFLKLLKNRMDKLVEEVEQPQRSEMQRLQIQMQKLKQLQNKQFDTLKRIEGSRSIRDLKDLLSWQAGVCGIVSNLVNQDLDPPSTMIQVEVKTNAAFVQALLSLGFVEVKNVPFCVAQSLPQPGTTSDSTSVQPESSQLSTMSHLTNPSSVALTSAFPLPLQTTATGGTISPSSLSAPSASSHHSSAPLCLPTSWCSNLNWPLPPESNASNTCAQPLKPPTSSKPPVETNQAIFKSVNCVAQPVVMPVVLYQPTTAMMTNPQNGPHCRSNYLPINTRSNSHLPTSCRKTTNQNQKPPSSLYMKIVPVTSNGCSNTVMQKNHPRPNTSAALPSGPVAITPETSSKKQHQSLVVKAVADSACDQVAQQQQPAENIPTSVMSEDTKLAENLPTSTITEVLKPTEKKPRVIVLEEATVLAENIQKSPVSEDTVPAENIQKSPVSEDTVPAENIQKSPVSEDTVPAENIQKSPVSEDTVPAENIQKSPVSEDTVPAENIQKSPVSEDTVPAENIQKSPVSEDDEPAEDIRKSPVSEDTVPAENMRCSHVSEDDEPAEDIRKSPVSEDTVPAENIRKSAVSEDTVPAENMRCSHVSEDDEPAEDIRKSPVSEDTVPAENIRKSPVSEETVPAENIRKSPVSEETVPAEDIRKSPVSEETVPAENIRKSPVSEETVPAEDIRKSPVSEETVPAENMRCSPVSEDDKPAEDMQRSFASKDTVPAEDTWRSPVSEDDEPAMDIQRSPVSEDYKPAEVIPRFRTKSQASLIELPWCLLHPEHPLLHSVLPAENNQTSPKPAEELNALEITGRIAREFVIGQRESRGNPAPPTVSLFRLPLSLLRPGKPLFCFSPSPGDSEDKDDKPDENPESSGENFSQDYKDFTRPLSSPESPMSPMSPESPISLHILSCSVCGSSRSSIICSSCGRGYHSGCHVPPVAPNLRTDWNCSLCQDLNDPADPYSSERRAKSPEGRGLSVLDQRRCETLLLHLLVGGCHHLSQDSEVTSALSMISERLSLRLSPSYQAVTEFLSNIWTVFSEASSQDNSFLEDLQQMFHRRLMEMFRSKDDLSDSRHPHAASVRDMSKLKETRKRLKDYLDQRGAPATKSTKTF